MGPYLPAGGQRGTAAGQAVGRYIDEVWTDMRPLSVRSISRAASRPDIAAGRGGTGSAKKDPAGDRPDER